MLPQSFDGIEMPFQFHLGKHGVYLVVADFVKQDCGRTATTLAQRQQVVTIIRLRQSSPAKRTEFNVSGLHAFSVSRNVPFA